MTSRCTADVVQQAYGAHIAHHTPGAAFLNRCARRAQSALTGRLLSQPPASQRVVASSASTALPAATQWGFSVDLGHLDHVLVGHLAHPPCTLAPPNFSTRLPIVAVIVRFAVDSYSKYPTYPTFISISYIEKRRFYKLHPSIYSMDRLAGWISRYRGGHNILWWS